ncbi:MAG: hypothetical protein R3C26_22845 [Calditrichia bacterium]
MSEKSSNPKLITVLREGYSFSHFSKVSQPASSSELWHCRWRSHLPLLPA